MRPNAKLTDLVVVPNGFINIFNLRGWYIVGDDIIRGSRVSISQTFHRELGIKLSKPVTYECVLGFLTVIIIGLLTEIAKSILLRSRRPVFTRKKLAVAYLVDELSHFRNILSIGRTNTDSHDCSSYRFFRRQSVPLSFFVLLISIAIFLANVAAVYVTQPRRIMSKELQFNIVGMQPVGTRPRRAGIIQEVTEQMPCISPLHINDLQKRHYRIVGCITYDQNVALNRRQDVSEEIKISSWYHEGGSDHNVSFGEGWRSLSSRAILELDDSNHTTERILFHTSSDLITNIRYLHNLTIFRAMEIACRGRRPRRTCEELVEELSLVSSEEIEKEIELWTTDEGNIVRANSTGLVSTFRIGLERPFRAVSRALPVLVASTAVRENLGDGFYENASNGTRHGGIPGLLEERERVAGIYLLIVIIAVTTVILFALRFSFDPISLSHLALRSFQRAENKRKKKGTKTATTRVGQRKDDEEILGASSEKGSSGSSIVTH